MRATRVRRPTDIPICGKGGFQLGSAREVDDFHPEERLDFVND